MDDKDIWRTANVLIKKYGQDAVVMAAKRADAMLDLGDIEAQRIWRRVLSAIKDLTTVAAGEKPN